MFQQLLKQFLQKFVKNMGRQPQTRKEWMDIQNEAVQYINKTKGVPKKDVPPFQGWRPEIVGKDALEKRAEMKSLADAFARSRYGSKLTDLPNKKRFEMEDLATQELKKKTTSKEKTRMDKIEDASKKLDDVMKESKKLPLRIY